MLKRHYPQSPPPPLPHRNGMSVPPVSFVLLQTADYIDVFLTRENTDFISVKCKDRRIHQGMLLCPRRRNQGKETAACTQILFLYF